MPDHFAEREHAVVLVEPVARHRLGIGHRSVVGVVEEQHIAAAAGLVTDDSLDERVRVPFVDQNEVGTIENLVEIDAIEIDRDG